MAMAPTAELTDEIVYHYWENKAQEGGADPTITIRDHHFRELEINTVKRFLRPEDRVLDIGCGNGYSTLRYAESVKEIVGVDYSPAMIEAAGCMLEDAPARTQHNTSFRVEDARDLTDVDQAYTRVVMERCLINIPDRLQQIDAAREAGRVLKDGELFLLAEVTLQGHEQVNKYREMFGLEKLKVHWHNTYIDEPAFLAGIANTFDVVEIIRFGMYGFLSKVVHPLMVQPEEPAFDAAINEVAARIGETIPDFGGCSHQVLFVLRKRS